MIRSIPCRTLILSLTFLSAFQLAACQSEAPTPDVQTAAPAQRSIEVIADEFLAAMLERHPSLATNYSIEGARHDRLFDNSLDALDDWRATPVRRPFASVARSFGKPVRRQPGTTACRLCSTFSRSSPTT
jgi:hypothetical protein